MAYEDEAVGGFDDEFDPNTADFGSDVDDDAAVEGDAPAKEPEGEEPAAGDAEGEAEGEQDPDAEGEQEAEPKEYMVPKSRMDSFRRRLKEAEERLAATEAAAKPAEPAAEAPDFDAQLAELSEKFAQAAIDGDAKALAALNTQMAGLQRQQMAALVEASRDTAITQSRDSILTDTLVDELVSANEVLNPESKSFDPELVGRLNDMRDFYESKGLTESQALVKATEVLLPAALADKPAKTRQADLLKKVEAANAQPPNASKAGEDAPAYGRGKTLDFSRMSLKDLDNVSDAEWDDALGNTF